MSQRNRWAKYNEGKTTTERGYGHAWRKVREQRLKMDGYLCVKHRARGAFEQASEVDHIIEKANGGTDELSNLQSLCKQCHKDKTNRSKRPLSACDENGVPINIEHHWHADQHN